MIIQIATQREIKDEDYWQWVRGTVHAMKRADPDCPVNESFFRELMVKGSMSFQQDIGYTKVRTEYRIKEMPDAIIEKTQKKIPNRVTGTNQ